MDTAITIQPTDILDPENIEIQLGKEKKVQEAIDKYIEHNLVDGIDYVSVSIGGRTSKPSLSKAGSEKLCRLFNLKIEFAKDSDTWEMSGNKTGLYCYVCRLISKGSVVAEGRGSYEVGEGHAGRNDNGALKMAQKRAQVDACLRLFALSDRFTQDLEDMPKQATQDPKTSQTAKKDEAASIPQKKYIKTLKEKAGEEKFTEILKKHHGTMIENQKTGEKHIIITKRNATSLIDELVQLYG